jgi:hypothetical protein
MIGDFRIKIFRRFVLLACLLLPVACKNRDVEIRNDRFTPNRGYCDVEFDIRNNLQTSIMAEVKLEAFARRSRSLESRGQKVVPIEAPAESTVHRIEKIKTSGRVRHVRVRLLRFFRR